MKIVATLIGNDDDKTQLYAGTPASILLVLIVLKVKIGIVVTIHK